MSEGPKVNLASLLNKPENEINNNQNTIEKEKVVKNVDYVVSMTTLTKEEVENLTPEQFDEVLQIIENTIKTKTKEEVVNNNLSSEEEDKKESEVENKEDKEEFDELFANYKSDFKKEEKSIFKSIKEKRERIKAKLRMPRTRASLIIGLITVTIIVISSLFILFPEKHSLSVYKTSILNTKAKYFGKNETTIKKIIKKEIINQVKKDEIIDEVNIDDIEKEKIKEALDNKYKN